MQIHLSRTAAACLTALVAFLFCAPPAARAQSGVENKLTVGVFSRAYLVQFFYRSETWKKKMQELMNARNQAALNSDSLKADQIDRELADLQTLAERQLSGAAPLTNIYDLLKPVWPAIAKEAKVDLIVESPLYVTPGSALVDVTSIIVRYLNKRE
jgi:hypothetical protein